MRLRLTVQADSALSLRWEVPDEPRLKLRAIEKLPVRRTPEGTLVYEREIVWQALEPAAMKIKNLAVKIGDAQMRFPEVTITVRDPSP